MAVAVAVSFLEFSSPWRCCVVKPPLRTKSLGTKVSDGEYARLVALASTRGQTISELMRSGCQRPKHHEWLRHRQTEQHARLLHRHRQHLVDNLQLNPIGAVMKLINGRDSNAVILLNVMSPVIICTLLLLCGCKAASTWSTESLSPDGRMIATADVFANGGFASAGPSHACLLEGNDRITEGNAHFRFF